MSDLIQTKLFDKIINVKLYSVDPSAASGVDAVTTSQFGVAFLSSYIECPKEGRKPSINIRGRMERSFSLWDIELRVTNLNTGDIPLASYKYLKVEAGYSGELSSTIEGEVVNAFQETPGPDGVTVFSMLQGFFSNFANVTATLSWPSGTSVNLILQKCAELLGMELKSMLDPSLVTQTSWSFTGQVSKFISDVVQPIGVNVYPDGKFLKAYDLKGSTNVHHVMRYFTSAPKKEASGFQFTAPWNPDLRPGDIVDVDVRYMRQTYGGAQVGSQGTAFIIQRLSFDFSTTDETNSMNVLTTEEPK